MALFAATIIFFAALISETGARILLCAYVSHGTGLASALEKLYGKAGFGKDLLRI
jgi:hypothetical protein